MKLLLILVLLLSGCKTLPPKVEVVTVYVPVITVPAPPLIIRPSLSAHELVLNSYGTYVQHIKVDLLKLQSYILELELIIENYKNLSKDK